MARAGEVRTTLGGAHATRCADDAMPVVYGYAAVFNSPTWVTESTGKRMVESIRPGAFARLLRSDPDIPMVIAHKSHRELARTSDGSLKLEEDEHGLRFLFVPRDNYGLVWVEEVRAGDVGASISMNQTRSEWRTDGKTNVREVLEVGYLIDVCLTRSPCYRATFAAVHDQAGPIDPWTLHSRRRLWRAETQF